MVPSRSATVTFSTNRPQIFEIPSRDAFTADEIQAAHYSKEDYKGIRRRAFTLIQLQLTGESSREDDCMRGLECKTTEGFRFVRNNRKHASFAVIDEQDRQDEVGISDVNLISEVYQKSSVASLCFAYAQGLLDAQDACQDDLPLTVHPRQQAVDPNTPLRCVLDTAMEDVKTETGFQVQLPHNLEEPQLDMMEWTAEAA